jgi:hypothetical protein
MSIKWSSIRNAFFFILFLEAFFWLGSWTNQGARFVLNYYQSHIKGTYKIMCLGDSVTAWGGDDSYPAQLERVLDLRSKGIKYKVINQGVAGATTSTILANLPGWIEEYRPSMVIVMAGVVDDFEKKKPEKEWGFYFNKLKVLQMFNKLFDMAAAEINRDAAGVNKYFIKRKDDTAKTAGEDESIEEAVVKEPVSQIKIYALAKIAEGTGRPDIAEVLYKKFLENDRNKVVTQWVISQFGQLLVDMRQYDQFVYLMPHIPYKEWPREWVKGYCHGGANTEHVRQIIENMVQNGEETYIYKYIVSCYEESGQKPLADFYLNKLIARSTGVYSPATQKNFLDIKDLLMSKNIQPVFMQYPMRDIKELSDIFKDEPDYDKIIFVDNGPVFRNAIKKDSYYTYFVDRDRADFGHLTPEGSRLLASNITDKILFGAK